MQIFSSQGVLQVVDIKRFEKSFKQIQQMFSYGMPGIMALPLRITDCRSSAAHMDGEFLRVFKSEVRSSPCVVSELLRMTERDSIMRQLLKTLVVWEADQTLCDILTSLFYLTHPIFLPPVMNLTPYFLHLDHILSHLSPKTSFGVGIFTHILQMGEPSLLKP